MDFLKLLNSLEDLVVEVALWLILLPRTLFASVFTPVTLAKYFDVLQVTRAEDRDDRYLSPVLFWILVAPASWVLILARTDKEAFAFYGDSWEQRLATSVLMLLGPPLGFALASTLVRRETVSKKSLRRHFALQCYFHAPMTFLWLLLFSISKYLETRFGSDIGDTISGILFIPPVAWFFITQYRVARRENEQVRSVGSVALGCGFGFAIMIAIALAITLIFFLLGRTPGFGR